VGSASGSTKAQVTGTFTVGGFDMASQVWDRMDATIEVSREDRDNFVKNMLTILAKSVWRWRTTARQQSSKVRLPLLAVDGGGRVIPPFNFMAIDVLSVVSIEEQRLWSLIRDDAVIKRYAQAALDTVSHGVMSRTGRKLMIFLPLLFRPCC
jgi:hypothetical protein